MTCLIPSGMSDKGPRLEEQAHICEASPEKPDSASTTKLHSRSQTVGGFQHFPWLCGLKVSPLFSRRVFFPGRLSNDN